MDNVIIPEVFKNNVNATDVAGNTVDEAKPVKYSKWRDKDFLRKYNREQRRKWRGGLLTHPYVLDDGRKWSDLHPYGTFNTKEEKLAYNRKFYKWPPKTMPKRQKIMCEACKKEYFKGYIELHLQSNKHKKTVELLQQHNVEILPQTDETVYSV